MWVLLLSSVVQKQGWFPARQIQMGRKSLASYGACALMSTQSVCFGANLMPSPLLSYHSPSLVFPHYPHQLPPFLIPNI